MQRRQAQQHSAAAMVHSLLQHYTHCHVILSLFYLQGIHILRSLFSSGPYYR